MARYGLHAGSGARYSIRELASLPGLASGIRTSEARFRTPHEIHAGTWLVAGLAQVEMHLPFTPAPANARTTRQANLERTAEGETASANVVALHGAALLVSSGSSALRSSSVSRRSHVWAAPSCTATTAGRGTRL
jgi:hypothetical protein